ncbi:GNAT family N-acetyltransferase [Corallococcus praedator]|uniref:GNAT family N-acetyltransferase n=1 Tax=Corallococcus praedator TaxID=2316724 RepID=A0ABX9Q8A8_9BACT|nr:MULTISPECIES: GNAT family N-acetyltransferase [Corallococcus]RKH03995.1 GNAT family N-acetyltransferase [Corallococcus sp. CA047B]RKH35283.1 GNAT family N-acetyltransferase [Corallococcus sp. CA031C]RKH94820.1 GNAT family N-acetyltransferase [Corallococcus praedator]
MVEIRTFEGDAGEASRFVNGVWQELYGKQLPLAVWDAHFFDWLLFREGKAPRDYLVAAYADGKLVGTLFAEPARIRLGSQEVDGTYGSWASVAPSHRRQGIGGKLAQEMLLRHRERGARLLLGCVAAGTDGPGFWHQTQHARILDGMGLWVHVFDAQALARWSMHASERALFTLARPFLRHRFRRAQAQGIRPYRPSDLPRCMALVQRMMKSVTLGYAYTAERLAHQLQYREVPRTFVLEQAGEVRGFVNSYSMRMTGRETMTAEVVDLMAFDDAVPVTERRRLLQVAMQDMERRGVSCAAMLRGPCIPAPLMWRAGWVPFPGEAKVTCLLPTPGLELPAAPSVFTHLR